MADASVYFDYKTVAPRARALANRHLRLWTDDASRQEELRRMRRSNAEWDFMGRTFLVLALASLSLRNPAERPALLESMDAIIQDFPDVNYISPDTTVTPPHPEGR